MADLPHRNTATSKRPKVSETERHSSLSPDRSLLGLIHGLFALRETLLFWPAEKVHAERDESAEGSGITFIPNSEVSERDYFHAEARGTRRDFCKLQNPRALQFRPFNYSAGTSVFGFIHSPSNPPRSPLLRVNIGGRFEALVGAPEKTNSRARFRARLP
jgi:hypothetical protein